MKKFGIAAGASILMAAIFWLGWHAMTVWRVDPMFIFAVPVIIAIFAHVFLDLKRHGPGDFIWSLLIYTPFFIIKPKREVLEKLPAPREPRLKILVERWLEI